MCGICGIIDFSNQIKEKKQLTNIMAEKILHRGPDDSGVFGDENISLGFKRLFYSRHKKWQSTNF